MKPGNDSGEHKEELVPLCHLLSRELQNERRPRPLLRHGHAIQQKKGEDYTLVKTDCYRIPGDRSSNFAIFLVLDGHNGVAAAAHAKDNLLKDVMGAMPPNLGRDEWLTILPRALVAGFVKTDKDFQSKKQSSGTTATFVVVDGLTVTVACVGDSRCILESGGGLISILTVDHRVEDNVEERDRIIASGGEVGRLSLASGVEVGPLRCWPGGLCLSRSIGDMDVGEFIVPIPHVKQVKLSSAGGRLIIASDGVWDAMSCERVVKCSRGLPAELAAKQVVKEVIKTRGLRDDTTCLVVDIIPPKFVVSTTPVLTKRSRLKALLFRCMPRQTTQDRIFADKLADVSLVEELFEEGSALLVERLGREKSVHVVSGLFQCAICQLDITPEGVSVHAGYIFSTSAKPWEGPFLCLSCKMKKDAMEGKKPTTVA